MDKNKILFASVFLGIVLFFGVASLRRDLITWAVVSAMALSIGVFILSRFVINLRRGSERTKWSGVTGEVVSSEVKETTSYGPDGSTDYFPIVRYRYTVNLVEYENDVISASEAPFAIGTNKYAKSQVARYPAGSTVNVFYNPDNPADAVLNKSGADLGGMFMLLVLGLAVLACGLAPLLGALFVK